MEPSAQDALQEDIAAVEALFGLSPSEQALLDDIQSGKNDFGALIGV